MKAIVERLQADLIGQRALGLGDRAVRDDDIRDLLKAYQEQRRALGQATITLRMLKRNVETEINRHDGLHRWEGVPEAIQARIDDAEDASDIRDLLKAYQEQRRALEALVTAVCYAAPPQNFARKGEELNLCYVARVPVDFISDARAALTGEDT